MNPNDITGKGSGHIEEFSGAADKNYYTNQAVDKLPLREMLGKFSAASSHQPPSVENNITLENNNF